MDEIIEMVKDNQNNLESLEEPYYLTFLEGSSTYSFRF